MNIIFLCRLYKPHIGGVEKHLEKISQLLSAPNKITIITEKYSSDLPDQEIIDGITIIRIPLVNVSEGAKKWHIWIWILKNKHIFDEADIIHCHDIVFWLYPYKLLNLSKKIYATFHGWEGTYPISLKNKLKRQFDARITSGNICIGDFITRWYGIKADYISYGAVDQIKNSSNKNSSGLLYLGRLDKDTNFEACLSLYERLKPSFNWQLTVVGDGELKTLVPQEAKFVGWSADPSRYVNSAKYVFTTGYLGILEALSLGKIVIASFNNPIKKDYLTSHPMAKYLCFTDNLPAALPKAAQNWANSQTWDNLVSVYTKLWQIQSV